jgi:NAD(P)-dependent dehydrogenase (short-subunit alcohol dehydrogenase family)
MIRWTASDLPNLRGRNAIVTGANSGIGRVAAHELARAGASVTLAVRDVKKGEEAASTMMGDVQVRHLDVANLSSVKAFAADTTGTVDFLIDNAGIMATPPQRTVDGFEMQFATNHLGHFALTNLLLPQISDRIIVVSSDLHRRGRIVLDDLNWERRKYKPWDAYSQSKLANLLFVLELARRLHEARSTVRAIGVHPGYAATNLQGKSSSRVTNVLGVLANKLIAQKESMGALPTLYATVADVASGSYVGPDGFQHMRGYPSLNTPASQALDATMAGLLWDVSEELTGVTWPLDSFPTD